MIPKAAWFLVGCLLTVMASWAGLLCLFGWEAVSTGANIPGWLTLFIPGVVLPLLGGVYCFRRSARAGKARAENEK